MLDSEERSAIEVNALRDRDELDVRTKAKIEQSGCEEDAASRIEILEKVEDNDRDSKRICSPAGNLGAIAGAILSTRCLFRSSVEFCRRYVINYYSFLNATVDLEAV